MSGNVRPDAVAYPPRGMSREEAARYVGVSPTKFDDLVRERRMPHAKRVDHRRVWDRVELDAYFSGLDSESDINFIDRALSEPGPKR